MRFVQPKRKVLFGLMAALALIAVYCVARLSEPSYRGKTISSWIKRFSAEPSSESAARKALQETGTPAIPYLVRAFEQKPAYLSTKYRQFWKRIPAKVQRRLPKPVEENLALQIAALNGLGLIGRAEWQSRSLERTAASPGLQSIVSTLATALRNTNEFVRAAAAEAVVNLRPKEIGLNADATLPGLIGMLQRGNLDEKHHAALALSLIGPSANAALLELLSKLQVQDRELRLKVVATLGRIGTDAEVLVPLLIELLQDPDDQMRWVAISSVARIGKYPPGTREIFIRELNDTNAPSDYRRAAAAVALWRMDLADSNAFAVVRGYLTWTNEGALRSTTANLVGAIGPPAGAVVPTLIELLNDRNRNVADMAYEALGRIDSNAAKAVKPVAR